MSVTPLRVSRVRPLRAGSEARRVYAIAFDIDTEAAEAYLGPNWRSCYTKIENVLVSHGFGRQQGSVFFGSVQTNAVVCMQAVQELDAKYAWFGRVIRDLRMLRIDEDNDLMPVLSNALRFEADSAA